MPLSRVRLILDTNTLLRGIARPESASGRLLDAVLERKMLLLTSRAVMDEYRTILLDKKIMARYPHVSARTIAGTLRAMTYLSDTVDAEATRFGFPRDPKDEKFLTLAIAGRASHLITFDNDLLSLPTSHTDAAKRLRQRLPHLRIQMSGDFLAEHEAEFA